jgi:hypothetical protein
MAREAMAMESDFDTGDLPVEFHERLVQLLRAMKGASLAGVRPGKGAGSWVVELSFLDRVERAVLIYAPDQVAMTAHHA